MVVGSRYDGPTPTTRSLQAPNPQKLEQQQGQLTAAQQQEKTMPGSDNFAA